VNYTRSSQITNLDPSSACKSTLRSSGSTQRFVLHSPSTASSLAHSTLHPYLLPTSPPSTIQLDPTLFTHFLVRFYHYPYSPSSTRSAYLSAATMGGPYILTSFIPLLPYFFVSSVGRALVWNLGVMVIALLAFGGGKAWVTLRSAEDLGGRRCSRV
jgi:VIT1/CCC1 family predicted Fe2+/Mn2+ transporter